VVTPVRASRILALLHVAHADAVAAAAEAHRVAGRRAPALAGDGVKALTTLDALDGYPSAHAAVAAASAAILSYAFSSLEDTTRFWKQAREAADARVLAGAATPIDADSGFALGRRVAAQILARARTDGSEIAWTGLVPSASFAWRPTPPKRINSPFDPLAGSWRPFVLSRADVHRPSPPPAEGSTQLAADLAELRRLAAGERTAQQADRARYWATEAPAVHWEEFLLDEVAARRLSTTESVRAFAYANVAMYDAFLACWDAKFHYWYPRPITVEPTLGTVFSTPPFPSYPSGHSTQSAAAAEVFAALFPDKAAHYRALGNEASLSRVWGGVHYRFDVIAGEELGASVGKDVVARMRRDGALR
jgi:membrane-associated phospholipid phosphatase